MMRRKSTISLDDPATKIAVELYKKDLSLKDAAATIYLSESGLRYRFKILGIPANGTMRELRSGRKLPADLVEKIRHEYRDGKSFYRIAKDLGVSAPTVRKYARKEGNNDGQNVVKGCVVIDEDEVQAICKVNELIEQFIEINRLIRSMSEKEFRMFERSLEVTKEEMENNG